MSLNTKLAAWNKLNSAIESLQFTQASVARSYPASACSTYNSGAQQKGPRLQPFFQFGIFCRQVNQGKTRPVQLTLFNDAASSAHGLQCGGS